MAIRVTQYAAYLQRCPYRYYIQQRASTPSLTDRVFSQIFVSYAGLLLINAKYDTDLYEKSQATHINVEY